nr:MAG TPA: hypothetical protein [Bacteriophage sp.]
MPVRKHCITRWIRSHYKAHLLVGLIMVVPTTG